MSKIILIVLMLATLVSGATLTELTQELRGFSKDQRAIIKQAYAKGVLDDLQYTMAAIVWEESKAGLMVFNSTTGDYGIMHINLYWYMRGHNLKLGYYGKIALASKFMRNDAFTLQASLENLLLWKRKFGNWREMVGGYNGGNTPDLGYASRIADKLKALKRMEMEEPTFLKDAIKEPNFDPKECL